MNFAAFLGVSALVIMTPGQDTALTSATRWWEAAPAVSRPRRASRRDS